MPAVCRGARVSARGREIAPALPGAHHPDCRCPDCELDRYWERREAEAEYRALLEEMSPGDGRCADCGAHGPVVEVAAGSGASEALCFGCAAASEAA